MMNKFIPLLVILSMVLLFALAPELDLIISSLFFDSATMSFTYSESLIIKSLFFLIHITLALFVLAVAVSGLKKLKQFKSLHPKYYKPEIFIGLTASLGPGLFVHEFLKKFVGRPRPLEIQNFGGNSFFQKVFETSNQCVESCSFVSGHSSIGFIFMTLAFVSADKDRNKFLILGVLLGLFFGLIRIIQGAHFASDVVFAGVVVYITALLLDFIIKPRTPIIK